MNNQPHVLPLTGKSSESGYSELCRVPTISNLPSINIRIDSFTNETWCTQPLVTANFVQLTSNMPRIYPLLGVVIAESSFTLTASHDFA